MSKAWNRGTENLGGDGGLFEAMRRQFAKQLCKRKLVEWLHYLDNECPKNWDERILSWVTRQEAFKNGDIIKQAEEAKGNEEILQLILAVTSHGIRGISMLEPNDFDWWWDRCADKGSALDSVAESEERGDNYYDDFVNDFSFNDVPEANLKKLVLAWLKSKQRYFDDIDDQVLLYALECALEAPCLKRKVEDVIAHLESSQLSWDDGDRLEDLKKKLEEMFKADNHEVGDSSESDEIEKESDENEDESAGDSEVSEASEGSEASS